MGYAGDQPNRDALDLAPTGSAPANAVQGTIIYHTTSGLIYYTGSAWKSTNSTILDDVGNVNAGIKANENSLVWDSGSSEWKPSGVKIASLSDVSASSPTLEDSLVWNGSSWVASGVTGGGGASALNDLSDVNTAGLAADEALVYNGSTWVPAPMDLNTNVAGDLGQLDDVSTTGLGDASGLAYNQGSKVWEPKNFNLGHHVSGSLDDLTDASLTAPASGELLKYDGSNWVNVTAPTSGFMRKLIDAGNFTGVSSLTTATFDGIDAREVEFIITDIDVTADCSLECVVLNPSDTEQTGASDYCWHLDGGAAAGEFGQGDNADDSFFISFNDASTRYDTDVNGRGSARITYKNAERHENASPTKPAHFEFSSSQIRPDGSFQSHYGHAFYYGAIIGSDRAAKLRVKTTTGNFSGSYEVWALVPIVF